MHSRNKLNPLSSNVSGIFHIHTIEEAYYPSHPLQQLEAAMKIYRMIEWKTRKNVGRLLKKQTCLTNLYINLSKVNNTYDWFPIIARHSSSNFVLSVDPLSRLYNALINLGTKEMEFSKLECIKPFKLFGRVK